MDLVDLLRRPEVKTLELKRDLSTPKGVLKSIVAFANTSGGVLLIDVEDGTRSVRGVDEPLDLEERLANLISDQIAPRLVPELEIVPWRGSHVLAVQVFPARGVRTILCARAVTRACTYVLGPRIGGPMPS